VVRGGEWVTILCVYWDRRFECIRDNFGYADVESENYRYIASDSKVLFWESIKALQHAVERFVSAPLATQHKISLTIMVYLDRGTAIIPCFTC